MNIIFPIWLEEKAEKINKICHDILSTHDHSTYNTLANCCV